MDTGVEEMTKWQNSFEGFGGNPERRNLKKLFFPEKNIFLSLKSNWTETLKSTFLKISTVLNKTKIKSCSFYTI